MWTSGGQVADIGMLIARTDADVPKHQGITYFAIDMHQKGVEIRPLVEMTGHAMFNEVFMEEATVPDSALIGGLNNGWAVANTTLMNERAGLGSGGGHAAASAATPGTVVKDLAKRAGDFVSGSKKKSRGDSSGSGAVGMLGAGYTLLVELAKGNGKIKDPSLRQDLMKLHTLNELGRMNNLRAKAAKAAGLPDVPGLPNISKLSMSEIVRQQRDIGLRILGPYGTLARLHRRADGEDQRRHRQPVRRDGHEPGALRAGAAHLRRHRPDPAQHHRRARPRPPQGGQQRQGRGLQGPPQERLTT